MKPILLLSALLALTSAQQVPLRDHTIPNRPPLHGHLPTMTDSSSDKQPVARPAVAIADVLGSQRSITTFSSFSRLQPSTDRLLADLAANTTVLAPLNSAVDALPRKPWEDPRDYENLGPGAYAGGDGQERARKNLLRFVEAHLVAGSPWAEGDESETVLGRKVWWEERDEKRVVMPDGIEVERVASQVSNGEVVSFVV